MSTYYKDCHTLYNKKIASAQIVEINLKILKLLLMNLIIQTVKTNFNKSNIKFKRFEFENDEINGIGIVYFENNFIYFSNKLGSVNIDRIKKFKMLETCCHFFKINLLDLLINSSPYFSH
jgi:predicted DNA-binding helix-hairpin-helix protein